MSDVEDAVDQILDQWGRERPDLDCSPMGIIGRITQLQREVFLAQRATFSRLRARRAVLRRPGGAAAGRPPYQLTPTALMRTALVTSGAITQRLDRLEEKGLITRERSEADGRAVVVTLTEAGRTALDAALPDHLETERQLIDGLSAAEQDQLADLLRRLLVARGRVPQSPLTGGWCTRRPGGRRAGGRAARRDVAQRVPEDARLQRRVGADLDHDGRLDAGQRHGEPAAAEPAGADPVGPRMVVVRGVSAAASSADWRGDSGLVRPTTTSSPSR